MTKPHRATLFGLPLDLLTMDETLARCRELILAGRPAQHVALNAAKVLLAQDDVSLREIIRRAAIVNADGQAIVWAGRMLGVPVPERVTGIDLMERLLRLAEMEHWPVFFLGAREDVSKRFIQRVRDRHPRIAIAGAAHGYFDNDTEIAETVGRSGAQLLLVALPSPRKEFFLAKQLPRMGALLAVGVGGSFDVWAGRVRRAPAWVQRVGLEWAFRLLQEPRRMWRRYLIGNPRFLLLFLRACLHHPGHDGPSNSFR